MNAVLYPFCASPFFVWLTPITRLVPATSSFAIPCNKNEKKFAQICMASLTLQYYGAIFKVIVIKVTKSERDVVEHMKNDIFSLKGKVCIVTGGYQGIGETVAAYIADAGADIVIFDISDATEVADRIGQEYGVRAKAYICDVTKPEMVDQCIAQAATDMGTLDLLFNNAGICLHKSVLDCDPQDWLRVIDVNLNGVYYMARAFGKFLIDNNKTGNIVNTASMSATIVNIPQRQASYNASKAAVVHLTKSLAVEWVDKGIRVNSISPGYIRTAITAGSNPEYQKLWIESIPMKRMGTPEELAGAVIYLLSDASTYTSGADLIIDGCFTIV